MKNLLKGLRVLVCLAVFFALAGRVSAQGRVNLYTTTTFTASWSEITRSSYQFTYPWGGCCGGTTNQHSLSLPFAFVYDKTTIASGTTVTVSNDCSVALGTNVTNGSNGLGSSTFPGVLLPLQGGAMAVGDQDNGDNNQYYTTTGSAPNRVFIIEFRRIHFQGSNGQSGAGTGGYNQTNMQVKLYETTGVIEFLYRDHKNDFNTSYNQFPDIGLNGFSSPSFTFLKYAAGLSSTPSSDLRFTPPAPPAELSLLPKTINFGPVPAGVPVTATITAYSVGAVPLTINGYSVSGAPDYTMTVAPVTGDIIPVGSSRTYTVRFSPITAGSRLATFTLFTSGADSGQQSVSLLGVGTAPAVSYGKTDLFRQIRRRVGDTSAVQYIPITSNGTGPLAINSIYLIGLNSDNYTVSRMPQNPLPTGVTDSIGIRFTPKMEGRPDASVVISTNGFNKPFDTVALFGIGTLARLVVSPQNPSSAVGNTVSMKFDSVGIGDSVCQGVLLQNTGSDTLYILRQVVTSADYDYSFYPLTGPDTMLVPGQTRVMSICFKPLKAGNRLASFRIFTSIPKTFEATPRDTSQFNIAVTGVGVAFGRLVVIGPVLDSVLVPGTVCVNDTFVNTGLSSFDVSSVRIGSGADSALFTVTAPSTPFTIGAGQKIPFSWCFKPTDRGERSIELQVHGKTSDRAVVDSFLLTGFGLHECATPSPAVLYDTVLLGQQDRKTVTVQNCGDITATDSAFFASSTSPAFALGSAAVQGPIVSGGNASYIVMFSPTALGPVTGTLNIAPVAGTQVALNGFGIGIITAGSSNPLSVARGNCLNDTVIFPNMGNIPWTPGTPLIAGADVTDFTLVSSTPGPVAPGDIVQVVIKFCPSRDGQESVTIDFPQSTPATPYTGTPYTLNATGGTSSVLERVSQDGFILGQSFPNPTVSTADVIVTIPTDATVRVELLDATGAVVRTGFAGHLSAGSHVLSIDANGLASGSYYYILTSGDIRLTRQMMIVK